MSAIAHNFSETASALGHR